MDIAAVLVRAVVLVTAIPLSGWAFAAATGGADANIGAGLFAFTVAVVISGVWGFLDGRRSHASGPIFVRWVVVAVLVVLGLLVLSVLRDGTEGTPVAESVSLALFFLGLVAVPALVGVALGAALRPGPRGGREPA